VAVRLLVPADHSAPPVPAADPSVVELRLPRKAVSHHAVPHEAAHRVVVSARLRDAD